MAADIALAFCLAKKFWQIEGDGASRFTAFFTDMAMARTSLAELKVGYLFLLASLGELKVQPKGKRIALLRTFMNPSKQGFLS